MLPYEVQRALEAGASYSEEFRITDSHEGWICYKNMVDTPAYRKKFFPYSRPADPIVAEPVTSSIINRLVATSRAGATYRCETHQELLDEIIAYMDFTTLSDTALTRVLATGSQLFWLSIAEPGKVVVDLVQPFYSYKAMDENFDTIGYVQSYNADNTTTIAPVDKMNRSSAFEIVKYVDAESVSKWKNGRLIYSEPHNLPFIPAIWCDSIDKDEDGIYGIPFVNRFKSMLMQLNATLSQKQKALVFLQNVWIARTDFVPGADDTPLEISPDVINFVSSNGSLEQVVRNLNLTEESAQIEYLKRAIYRAAQVPQDDDLSSKGKIESGVALKILYSQLEEVVSRIRRSYKRAEEDLLEKVIRTHMMSLGMGDPGEDLVVSVEYEIAVTPEDVQAGLTMDLTLLQNKLVTREALVRKYNTNQEDIDALLTINDPETPAHESLDGQDNTTV